MVFFIWSLILSLILTVIFAVLLLRAVRVNHERKNRHPASYLMPVALTLVFLYLTINLTMPRLLDTVNLISRMTSLEDVPVTNESLSFNVLVIDGQRYFFNQWQITLEPGSVYRIEYTPRSRYIVAATRVETTVASPRTIGVSSTAVAETMPDP